MQQTLKDKCALLPENARRYYHHGLSLVHGGDWTGAEAAFGCALEIDENFHDARYNLAKLLKEKGDFEKAVFAYRTLLEKQPSHEDSLYNLANLHCELDQLSEATALYSQVLKQNPEHINALVNLSLIKERQGQKRQAVKLLERAVELDPNHRHAYRALRRQYSKSVAAWHFDMLNDHERNQAYLSAISSAVTEKTHVLEIGTGSGLLSMMAARAGARKVTTCEMVAPLARVAGKIIAKNGYADRIKVIPKKSTSLRLGEDVDELADILIAEVFDNGLLGEHFLPSLLHARQTLLTKEAVVIPMGATVSGMLVSCPEMRNVNPMGSICGFDLGAFDVFRREGYKQIDLQTLDHQALSQPVSLCRLNFQTGVLRENRKIVPFPIEKTGTCHALVFWYDLHLDRNHTISTLSHARSNHWKQAIHFFDRDYPLVAGSTVQLMVHQTNHDINFEMRLGNPPRDSFSGSKQGSVRRAQSNY